MSDPLRVLFLENIESDAELVERELGKIAPEVQLLRVDRREAFEAGVREFKPDLILSDHALAGFNGIEALAAARRIAPDVPFIFVTGSLDEETAVDSIKAGAADYVLKERLVRLGPAVAGALERRRMRAQRLRAEEALALSEARLARAQALAHLGSWELELTDLQHIDRNPLWWSDEVYRIFGFDPQAFPASNEAFFHAVPLEDASRIRDAVARALTDGSPYFVEHRVVRPDGSERIVQERGIVEQDDRGLPLRLVGTILDVTDRRRLEQQLQHAQKMESVGRLAGGIAHDFNNIMTAILGYADLLIGDLERTDRRRDDLVEIRAAAERAATLTRQLLAFSRRQVLELRPVHLNDVVRDVERLLERLIGEDVRLATRLTPELSWIRADPGQVEQVLVNLAVNARDAMPLGGELTIETSNVFLEAEHAALRPEVTAGPHVLLSVSDTGSGMTLDVREHLFEPFFTTKEVGKGTGLGLATVYGIIQQSEGSIQVQSELGRGSSFRLYFPAISAPDEQLQVPDSLPPPQRGAETILLAEDEGTVRSLARRVLEGDGYRVLESPSPGDALRLSAAHPEPIHLLLTDVVMPELSGRKLAERLRARHPAIRVLYMSGFTDDAVLHHGGFELGSAYIQKPFTPESLLRKVREVLDRLH